MVLDQVRPRPRDPDELHDLLLSLVMARPCPDWAHWFDALAAAGRASLVDGCWVATERRDAAALARHADDDAAAACIAGHLQLAGPVSVGQLVADAPLPSGAPMGRAALGGPGAHRAGPSRGSRARRSSCPTAAGAPRNLLVRLHGASRSRRRRMVERGADRRLRAVPDALAARDARQPGRGTGRVAPGARAAGGDRGAGGGVGGPDPPGPGRPATTPAGSTSCASPARWCGAACTPPPRAGRSQRHALAGHAAGLRRARRPPDGPRAPCGPGSSPPSPRSARRPTSWRRCARRGACFRPELALRSPAVSRPRWTRGCGIWSHGVWSPPTPSRPCARCCPPATAGGTRTVRRPSGRLARRAGARGDRHRGGPLVAPAGCRGARAAGGRRRGALAGQRGAGGGGGAPAAGALGRRRLGGLEPRVVQGALARGGVGVAPVGGARRRTGGPVRRRPLRGAVRAARGLRGPAGRAPIGRRRRTGGRGRRRSAQHDRLHHRRRPRADVRATSAWSTATASWWNASRRGERVHQADDRSER